MKKVCMIMGGVFPVPDVRGGAVERLVTGYMDSYDKTEYELTICSVYDKAALEAARAYPQIRFVWTHTRRLDILCRHAFFMAIRALTGRCIRPLQRHYNELISLIQEEQFDLVIAEGGDYQAVLDICKGYPRERLAVHVHHHLRPTREVAAGFGHCIGTSQFVTEEYMKRTREQDHIVAHTVYNGISHKQICRQASPETVEEIKAKYGLRKEDFVVLYVGRIQPEKGPLKLAEAIVGLKDERIKLLLVGSANFSKWEPSPYKRQLQRLVNQAKGRIQMTGYIPNAEIYPYIQCADVWCVPSLCQEAAGLVAIEAMASGKPLLVTRSGGLVEYANERTARIVEIDQQLVEALQREILYYKGLTEEQRAAIGEEGRRRAALFTEEQYSRRLCDLIKELAAKGGSSRT